MEYTSNFIETAPVTQLYTICHRELKLEEAIEILRNPNMDKVSTAPASMPHPGEVYVFVLDEYDKRKISKIRADGYKWENSSGKILHQRKNSELRIQKYYSTKADHRVKRHEYRLCIDDQTADHEFVLILHYLADDDANQTRRVSEISATASIVQTTTQPIKFDNSNVPQSSVVPITSTPNNGKLLTNHRGALSNTAFRGIERRLLNPPCHYVINGTSCTPSSSTTPKPCVISLSPLKRPASGTASPSADTDQPLTKLSKNRLLGQQIEVTLDALSGDDLVAAREEIFNFLRKWDKS